VIKTSAKLNNTNVTPIAGLTCKFSVTQALVSLLATDVTKLFQQQTTTLCSPGGTGYSYVSPALKLANALSACFMSTSLSTSKRTWALKQLHLCLKNVSNDAAAEVKANLSKWSCDFSGSLPKIRMLSLEAHTSKTGQPLWLPAQNLIVTCGFDGTVRTWTPSHGATAPSQNQVRISVLFLTIKL